RLNREETIARIVGPVEQRLKLKLVGLRFEGRELLIGLSERSIIAGFGAQLVERADIIDLAQASFDRIDRGLQKLHLCNDGLCRLLVIPEPGRAHFVFEFFFASVFGRQVKESPGWRSPGMRGFRSIGRGSRESWQGTIVLCWPEFNLPVSVCLFHRDPL